MDDGNSAASAFGVMGDRFCAIGSDGDLKEWLSSSAELVDLEGKTVLPGFIESHTHASAYAMNLMRVDCSQAPNRAIGDIKTAIRKKAQETPSGRWIQGFGYDNTLITDKRHLNRSDLDETIPNHPIEVMHVSVHFSYVNSKAFNIAGIGPETPQPEGGVIHKDESGVPNGLLTEPGAMGLVRKHVFHSTPSRIKDALLQAFPCLHRYGVTSIHYYWGDRHESLFLGPQRVSCLDPLNSAADKGLPFCLHSDLPVTPVDHRFSSHTAVNRLTSSGRQVGPERRIPVFEALKTYTVHAAESRFEEANECYPGWETTWWPRVGEIHNQPNTRNVIPDYVHFTIDMRSWDYELYMRAWNELHAAFDEITTRQGCSFRFYVIMRNKCTPFDRQLINLIDRLSDELGYPKRHMLSGAGHDAVLMACLGPTAMIFVTQSCRNRRDALGALRTRGQRADPCHAHGGHAGGGRKLSRLFHGPNPRHWLDALDCCLRGILLN